MTLQGVARASAWVLCVGSLWFAALSASAQDKRAETAAGEGSREYRALIEEALKEFEHSNWEEAGALFARAHALEPSARTLRGMGLAAYEGRHYVESLQHLRAALVDSRRPLTAPQRAEVERTIERAERYVGRVEFALEPVSAEVKVDGRRVALQDSVLIVDAGLLDLEISASGYVPAVRRVRVAPGATERVEVTLLASGAQTVDYADPEPSAPPPPATPDRSSGLSTWKWVTAGTAVAGIGLGVAGLLLSNSAADEWNACLDATNPRCVQANDRSQTWRIVSIVGFATGGALAALSTVFWVIDGGSADTDSNASACTPGGFELGLECHVRF